MFTLRSLLLIVAVAALGTAGLVYRTPYWASAIVTLTLGIFAFGLLRIYSHPEKRGFWVPVSGLGWLYLWLSFVGEPLSARKQLPVTQIVFELWNRSEPMRGTDYGTVDKRELYKMLLWASSGGYLGGNYSPAISELENSWDIAHCLAALAFGFGGGAIYSWSITRKKDEA